jgi:hypothetical protein
MVISLIDALNIVNQKIECIQSENIQLALTDNFIEKDDYWVFFYDSKDFLETGDYKYVLAGNAPLIVDKFEGKVYETGTAYNIEYYMKIFEDTELPKIKKRIT